MVLRQVCLCHYPQETEHRGWCCTEWSLLIRSILSLTQSCKPSHHGRLCHSADRSQHVSQSVFVYSPEFMSKSQSSVKPSFLFLSLANTCMYLAMFLGHQNFLTFCRVHVLLLFFSTESFRDELYRTFTHVSDRLLVGLYFWSVVDM